MPVPPVARPGSSPAQLPPSVPVPRGVSRRAFTEFCAAMAAALALPMSKVTRALAADRRLPVVWIAGQDCTGDTESLLRAVDPDIVSLLFDVISLDYHETLMVAAGETGTAALDSALRAGGHVCVVEGSVPLADGGIHCVVGGETALSLVRRATAGALFTVAAGSCACDGGIAAAAPNPTGATGVAGAVPGLRNLVNMPGCPVNGVNLVAALVYYLTEDALPPLDSQGRPLLAYQSRIHGNGRCERFDDLRAGRRAEAWGDEIHRTGGCLMDLGCHGPSTYANCYQRNWNGGSWPVGTGSVCVGCTTSGFWDANTPFFEP
jgi:hydrogenase small subunit